MEPSFKMQSLSEAMAVAVSTPAAVVPARRTTTQAPHPLVMIPGPVEFSDEVLEAMSTPPSAHTGAAFTKTFSEVLRKTRLVFGNEAAAGGQPLVVSGSGTLGWDFAGANLIANPASDKVLCVSTGFFSNGMVECLSNFVDDAAAQVTVLEAPLGATVPLGDIEAQLRKHQYQVIALTHTDTSTGVLTDIEAVGALVRRVSPSTMVVVDAVCSAGCEEIQFDNWGLDFVLTASQKAMSTPAGLSIMMASQRAVDTALASTKKRPVYCSMAKWIPIMRNYEANKPSYFATPSVQLVTAYNVSLDQLIGDATIDPLTKIPRGMMKRFAVHKQVAQALRAELLRPQYGLQSVCRNQSECCHGMTALYVPESLAAGQVVGYMQSKYDITIAGGIHPKCPTRYIRIGHMGVSVTDQGAADVKRTAAALAVTLKALQSSKF
ncbi:alanine--glyoxylate aminotransferase 1 [Diutina catenulata]